MKKMILCLIVAFVVGSYAFAQQSVFGNWAYALPAPYYYKEVLILNPDKTGAIFILTGDTTVDDKAWVNNNLYQIFRFKYAYDILRIAVFFNSGGSSNMYYSFIDDDTISLKGTPYQRMSKEDSERFRAYLK